MGERHELLVGLTPKHLQQPAIDKIQAPLVVCAVAKDAARNTIKKLLGDFSPNHRAGDVPIGAYGRSMKDGHS